MIQPRSSLVQPTSSGPTCIIWTNTARRVQVGSDTLRCDATHDSRVRTEKLLKEQGTGEAGQGESTARVGAWPRGWGSRCPSAAPPPPSPPPPALLPALLPRAGRWSRGRRRRAPTEAAAACSSEEPASESCGLGRMGGGVRACGDRRRRG
eukprot:1281671-Rhodomonas_salina.1